MNQKPQIFLFWFSLVKVSSGWWWTDDEVNKIQCLFFIEKEKSMKFPILHPITNYIFSSD